ncbi:uncharacterized protein LDX57_000330 [Aspergillus melleus]|uniref:uncharacterized protein n=1 Tax=Aspergillus melleus TaxID=138277 RepID=UPI001E8EA8CD|nr:uncharacterized protein LDX57_000330 [Aspergillus melleus]KAH8422577.1 hypothetical protein LDX57_000330 [Aspergillus melleus]
MTASLARNLASQSVHLTIHPPPRSLSESKLVLSALQKYGEVVTFKNLKYDKTNTNPTAPRNTIAVFESPQAAKAAIASSPLRIVLPSSHATSSSSLSASSSVSSTTTSSSSSPSSNPSTQLSTRTHPPKTLFCNLQPSRHNHLSSLHRNPCYGSFKPDKESHQAGDLRRTGIPLKELADVPVRWKLGSSQAESRSRVRSPSLSLSRGQGQEQEQEQKQEQIQGQGQTQAQAQAQAQGEGDGATDTGVGVFAWSKRKRCRMGGTSLQALYNTKVADGEGGKIWAEEGKGKRE